MLKRILSLNRYPAAAMLLTTLLSTGLPAAGQEPAGGRSFAEDLAFLKKNTEIVVLADASGRAQVAVAPAMQGRVMTSTAEGLQGLSFGWINRELIASRQTRQHFNPFGGEDRFWLGPEGGQFSIFFSKGAPFDLEHWFTPASLDTLPFGVESRSQDRVGFVQSFSLTNYSGAQFQVEVRREVRLLPAGSIWKKLNAQDPGGLAVAAFESDNRVTNRGKEPWKRDTGALSIWILGMFTPSPATTIVVPIKPGADKALGKAVNADYFGRVPDSRLVVGDGVLFFRGDGEYRSKIGVGPRRARPIVGSYDAAHRVLTLVVYSLDESVLDYVNSAWEIQKDPYAGDVVNSYNDGPPSPGTKPMGPFYELETSSPALMLDPGQSGRHAHCTIHFRGSEPALDKVARSALGVSLAQITAAFARR